MAVAAMVIVGVAYVAHGLLTTADPDYDRGRGHGRSSAGRGRATPTDCAGRLCGGRQR